VIHPRSPPGGHVFQRAIVSEAGEASRPSQFGRVAWRCRRDSFLALTFRDRFWLGLIQGPSPSTPWSKSASNGANAERLLRHSERCRLSDPLAVAEQPGRSRLHFNFGDACAASRERSPQEISDEICRMGRGSHGALFAPPVLIVDAR
jgi:hypothetical protein